MTTTMMHLLLLTMLTVLCGGFPDHLQGRAGCLTELATDEVIMNSYIVGFDDSRDREIQVVVEGDNGEILVSPIVVTHVPITFNMVVTNPNRVPAVQYVMDTSLGATFERGWCPEQNRVGGRPGDLHALTIHSIPENGIQVWAGWAAGRQAVTLTNHFLFVSSNGEASKAGDITKDEF